MIVCWVLFALASLASMVGGVGYWHYQGEIQSMRELPPETEVNPFADLIPPLPDGFTLDSPANANPVETELERRIYARERQILENQEENFAITGIIAATLAGIILLWNIILYTGHWIWMGRKTG